MIHKRKIKFEVLFVIGFLTTLIIAFGTFYLGLRMGVSQTEAKYSYLKTSPPELETSSSYEQQDLVTYYYVVFQPYQQFKDHFEKMSDIIKQSDSSSKSKEALRKIRSEAQKQYEQIAANSIAAESPLLKESHNDILKSLKLFDQGIGNIINDNKNVDQLRNVLYDNSFTSKGINYGLQAQKKYYTSILKWTAKSNHNVATDYTFNNNTTIKQWKGFSLSIKNKAVTDIMLKNTLFVSYLPQDMTAKIDQMIKSGKAESLKLENITSIVKILTETDAIQKQEFVKWRNTYYVGEFLPTLPFFVED